MMWKFSRVLFCMSKAQYISSNSDQSTVEDTATSFEELESNFGANVKKIVEQVTDDKALSKGLFISSTSINCNQKRESLLK